MNCQDNKLTIMEYLDGELPPDAKRRLEEHLAACEACRQEFAAQRRVIAGVKSLQSVPAPPGLAAGIREAIAEERAPRMRWTQMIRRYGAIAASVAIIICAYALIAKNPKSLERPAPSRAADAARQEEAKLIEEEERSAGLANVSNAPALPSTPSQPREKGAAAVAKVESKARTMQPSQVGTKADEYRDVAAKDKSADAMKTAPAEPLVAAPRKPAAKQIAAVAAEQPRADSLDRAGFDLVIETDNAEQSIGELAKFLEDRDYTVLAKISARHSVLLAQLRPAQPKEQADAEAPPGIVQQIVASGKFHVSQPADEFAAGAAANETPRKQPALQGGKIAILIVNRNAAASMAVDGDAAKTKAPEKTETK